MNKTTVGYHSEMHTSVPIEPQVKITHIPQANVPDPSISDGYEEVKRRIQDSLWNTYSLPLETRREERRYISVQVSEIDNGVMKSRIYYIQGSIGGSCYITSIQERASNIPIGDDIPAFIERVRRNPSFFGSHFLIHTNTFNLVREVSETKITRQVSKIP